jgi:hypothetical protein
MANQLNFPSELQNVSTQRPPRVDVRDLRLIENQQKQILFGTSTRDKVELWLYNPDNTFAGHTVLSPSDPIVTLTTYVDQSGPSEVLNLDLTALSLRMGINPGRYVLVSNFFRDEIGSEAGYKLYVSDISNDRTEIQLYPVNPTQESYDDIFDFITPSVPKLFAQGLVDQLFGVNLDAVDTEKIRQSDIDSFINQGDSTTIARLQYSGLYNSFVNSINIMLPRVYKRTLDLMAGDVVNYQVQKIELIKYLMTAFDAELARMVSSNEFNPYLELI